MSFLWPLERKEKCHPSALQLVPLGLREPWKEAFLRGGREQQASSTGNLYPPTTPSHQNYFITKLHIWKQNGSNSCMKRTCVHQVLKARWKGVRPTAEPPRQGACAGSRANLGYSVQLQNGETREAPGGGLKVLSFSRTKVKVLPTRYGILYPEVIHRLKKRKFVQVTRIVCVSECVIDEHHQAVSGQKYWG